WCYVTTPLDVCFFFSRSRRHTRSKRDWSSDVCSSDLLLSRPSTGPRGSNRGPAARETGGGGRWAPWTRSSLRRRRHCVRSYVKCCTSDGFVTQYCTYEHRRSYDFLAANPTAGSNPAKTRE